jgi:hypothetical protein
MWNRKGILAVALLGLVLGILSLLAVGRAAREERAEMAPDPVYCL